MSDENTQENIENVEQDSSNLEPSIESLQAEINALKAEKEALNAKKEEILTERKQDKLKFEKEQAEKDKNFQKLAEIAQQERDEMLAQLEAERQGKQELQQGIVKQNIDNLAMKLALELDAVPDSADLLAEHIAKELMNLKAEDGSIDNNTRELVKKQFSQDKKFAALLLGNQSSGGGAKAVQGGAFKQTRDNTKTGYDLLEQVYSTNN